MTKVVFLSLIRAYQRFISPLFPPQCRFQPTCSNYALEAIAQHGVLKGSWLTTSRICRCNPLFPGGYDPVPPGGEGGRGGREGKRSNVKGCSKHFE